ncbi:hemolysin III family protein [Eubacteriaceae bacterium ES3]|nr:hemolysin III family protein [Eubacteriaceae bacterium ES3]
MMKSLREPVNAMTHFTGLILSVIGIVFMLIMVTIRQDVNLLTIISILSFGAGLCALYLASFRYHAKIAGKEEIVKLKKMDHAMIFVLIAGTYTPFCLLALSGMRGIILMIAVWSVALIGIVLKVKWVFMPRWLGTAFYIFLGWFAIFVIKPLHQALPPNGFFLLVAGGVMYTVGGVIYALKKPNFAKTFGFHELFHIFVILGSFCHFLCVLLYLL